MSAVQKPISANQSRFMAIAFNELTIAIAEFAALCIWTSYFLEYEMLRELHAVTLICGLIRCSFTSLMGHFFVSLTCEWSVDSLDIL